MATITITTTPANHSYIAAYARDAVDLDAAFQAARNDTDPTGGGIQYIFPGYYWRSDVNSFQIDRIPLRFDLTSLISVSISSAILYFRAMVYRFTGTYYEDFNLLLRYAPDISSDTLRTQGNYLACLGDSTLFSIYAADIPDLGLDFTWYEVDVTALAQPEQWLMLSLITSEDLAGSFRYGADGIAKEAANVGQDEDTESWAYLVITYTTISSPSVTTDAASSVAQATATLNGTLDDDGGEACSVRFQYGLTNSYGTNTSWQTGKVTSDSFSAALTGLSPNTTYHFRAQANNSADTASGSDATFTTLVATPEVATDAASSIAQQTADLNGTLDDNGGEACDCGFEWGPTISYGTTTSTQSKTTGQSFSQEISGLEPNTGYHYRAVATNSWETGYGDDRSFTSKQRPDVNFRPEYNRAYALARWEL